MDQVQSSLSSLSSVAEDATSKPMETTPNEDPTSRESFSFPLVPVLGGEGSRRVGMSVEFGRGIQGEGIRVLLFVVMGGLGWDEGKYKMGEPRQARSVGRMG